MDIDLNLEVLDMMKDGNKRNRIKTPMSSPPTKRVQLHDTNPVTPEESDNAQNNAATTEPMEGEGEEEQEEFLSEQGGVVELKARKEVLVKDHKQVVKDLLAYADESKVDYESLKEAMNKIKKEDGLRKLDLKKVKDENAKLSLEIG